MGWSSASLLQCVKESGSHAPDLVIRFCVGLRVHWAVHFFPAHAFFGLGLDEMGAARGL